MQGGRQPGGDVSGGANSLCKVPEGRLHCVFR